eukprot:COSAG03_NODE_12412_length_548_cov_29.445131_2_plen_116_part_01
MSLSEHDKRSRSAAESGNSRPHKQAGKWGQESNATNDILGATRLEEADVAGDEAASELYAEDTATIRIQRENHEIRRAAGPWVYDPHECDLGSDAVARARNEILDAPGRPETIEEL